MVLITEVVLIIFVSFAVGMLLKVLLSSFFKRNSAALAYVDAERAICRMLAQPLCNSSRAFIIKARAIYQGLILRKPEEAWARIPRLRLVGHRADLYEPEAQSAKRTRRNPILIEN